jgi:hypothetical protein
MTYALGRLFHFLSALPEKLGQGAAITSTSSLRKPAKFWL